MSAEVKSTLANKLADDELGAGQASVHTDHEADQSYRRKVDFWVLPLLCLVMILLTRLQC